MLGIRFAKGLRTAPGKLLSESASMALTVNRNFIGSVKMRLEERGFHFLALDYKPREGDL